MQMQKRKKIKKKIHQKNLNPIKMVKNQKQPVMIKKMIQIWI